MQFHDEDSTTNAIEFFFKINQASCNNLATIFRLPLLAVIRLNISRTIHPLSIGGNVVLVDFFFF